MISVIMFRNESGDKPKALFYITEKTSTNVIEKKVKQFVGDDYDKGQDIIYGRWWIQEVNHIDEI